MENKRIIRLIPDMFEHFGEDRHTCLENTRVHLDKPISALVLPSKIA
jgi:hypothetical protein